MGRYEYICEFETIIEINKMNDHHDPKTGRFTFKPGSAAAFVPAKTAHEAVLYATQKLGFYDVDYGNMDLETINHVNLEITKIQEKYPEVRGAVQYLTTYNNNESFARIYENPKDGSISLEFNEGYYNLGISTMRKLHAKCVAHGFYPEGTKLESLIWHEYGHVIASITRKSSLGLIANEVVDEGDQKAQLMLYQLHVNKLPEKRWLRKACAILDTTPEEYSRAISKTAERDASEAVSEAFSEVNTSGKPREEAIVLIDVSGWYRN